MKSTVHIAIHERFGLSEEICEVVVMHSSFAELSLKIQNIYLNCNNFFIMDITDGQQIPVTLASYNELIDGGSLQVMFWDRSIESTIVVNGKYDVDDYVTFILAFPVIHNSFENLCERILQRMSTHIIDRLSILRDGNPVIVDADNYESLSPNGIIMVYLTRPGNIKMGSYYSTIDAFSARVLNFNFATPKTSTTDT